MSGPLFCILLLSVLKHLKLRVFYGIEIRLNRICVQSVITSIIDYCFIVMIIDYCFIVITKWILLGGLHQLETRVFYNFPSNRDCQFLYSIAGNCKLHKSVQVFKTL